MWSNGSIVKSFQTFKPAQNVIETIINESLLHFLSIIIENHLLDMDIIPNENLFELKNENLELNENLSQYLNTEHLKPLIKQLPEPFISFLPEKIRNLFSDNKNKKEVFVE